jgi:quercetin dioxygenase-like cupin family protein
MRRTRFGFLVVALLAAGGAAGWAAGASKPVTIDPVIATDRTWTGQPITFPASPGFVSASVYRIEPGAALPVHMHPAPRLGYVLKGTLRVTNTETGASRVFTAGQFIVESLKQWHKGDNPGTDPLELLVIDLTARRDGNTILQQAADKAP